MLSFDYYKSYFTRSRIEGMFVYIFSWQITEQLFNLLNKWYSHFTEMSYDVYLATGMFILSLSRCENCLSIDTRII